MTTTESSAVTRWLIAEYEAADLDCYPGDAESGSAVLGPGATVYVQPIFTLRSILHAGNAMRVIRADYDDPGRWWL